MQVQIPLLLVVNCTGQFGSIDLDDFCVGYTVLVRVMHWIAQVRLSCCFRKVFYVITRREDANCLAVSLILLTTLSGFLIYTYILQLTLYFVTVFIMTC